MSHIGSHINQAHPRRAPAARRLLELKNLGPVQRQIGGLSLRTRKNSFGRQLRCGLLIVSGETGGRCRIPGEAGVTALPNPAFHPLNVDHDA